MKRFQTVFRASAMLALCMACACQRTTPSPSTASIAKVRNHAEATVSPSSTRTKDSNAFTVEVSLSKVAQERLRGKETVIVAATYFGDPSPKALATPGFEYSSAELTNREIELSGADTASFPQIVFSAEQLSFLAHPNQIMVIINVFSGRRSSENNLLDCGSFAGSLREAARAPIKIHCKLIGESK